MAPQTTDLTPTRPAAPPAANAISARFVLHTVRQWWLVAAPVGLVVAATAALLIYLLHVPQYKATATMLIRNPEQILFNNYGNAQQYVNDQVELLRSDIVMEPILGIPEIARVPEIQKAVDPLRELSERVEVVPIGQSSYFQVSYTGPDPHDSANVVNQLTKSFLNLRSDHEDQRTRVLVQLLEEQQRLREAEVRDLKQRIRTVSEQVAGKDVPFLASANPLPFHANSSRMADLDRELATAETEVLFLQAQLQELRQFDESEPAGVPAEALERAVAQHPRIIDIEDRIALNQAKLDEYLRTGRETKVKDLNLYRDLERSVADDQKLLDETRLEMAEGLKEVVAKQLQAERADQVSQYERRIRLVEMSKSILEQQYDEQMLELKKTATPAYWELEFERMSLARAEEVVKLISDRLMQLNVERSAPTSVRELRPALPPREPIALVPVKLMVLGGGAGLVLPFVLALLWEMRIRRVSDTSQIEDVSRLPVIGEVAMLPVRRDASNGHSNGLLIFEESVDSLRTGLVLSEPLKNMRVLAVTSATSQEGKTSVASQLAVSIARATGERTLLIDGDMRSPDMHNVFDFDATTGLANVLSGEIPLDAAVVESWNTNLHILPAGELKTSPHKLVGQGRIELLLEEARAQYRYVVLDTPPLLSASEALVMAKAADASVVCAMRNHSRLDQVRAAFARLQQANARPAGVVLNGVPTRQYAHAYGKYAYSRD